MQQESINAEHKKTIVNKQKEIEAQSPAIQKAHRRLCDHGDRRDFIIDLRWIDAG